MEKAKAITQRLLYPVAAVKIISVPLAAAMLVYSLGYLDASHPFAYISYAFSAYVLTILLLGFPAVYHRCKAALLSNVYTGAYLRDAQLRATVSLSIGFFMNVLFAGFTLYSSISLQSPWFGAIALYYIVLCSVRFVMLKNVRQNNRQNTTGPLALQQIRQFRFSGYLLFAVTLVMTGVIFQIVRHNQSYQYPGMMIYAFAVYVFYHFLQAMTSAARFRRSGNLLFFSVKVYDLTAALMAILALQSAMFSRFGANEFMKQVMVLVTGIGICIAVLYMAIRIIIRANHGIRNAQLTFQKHNISKS